MPDLIPLLVKPNPIKKINIKLLNIVVHQKILLNHYILIINLRKQQQVPIIKLQPNIKHNQLQLPLKIQPKISMLAKIGSIAKLVIVDIKSPSINHQQHS
jgi:hypothetical protein